MAVTLTEAELAEALPKGAPAARLLPVAVALVQDYAPDAPEALQNEAVIRFAGYLAEARFGAVSSPAGGPCCEAGLRHQSRGGLEELRRGGPVNALPSPPRRGRSDALALVEGGSAASPGVTSATQWSDSWNRRRPARRPTRAPRPLSRPPQAPCREPSPVRRGHRDPATCATP